MSLNPYEPPQQESTSSIEHPSVQATLSAGADVPYRYESQETTIKWLVRLFVIIGIAYTVSGVIDLLNVTTSWPDDFWVEVGGYQYSPFWITYSTFALILLPASVATIVVYGSWIRRANRNARVLGAENMEFTPGWAFGWFFVPFANLFRPYQAVRELYQTSAPSPNATGWENLPATLVGWWWGLWLLANFASRAESRLFRKFEPEDVEKLASGFGVFTSILWVAATYLAANVVVAITRRQEYKRTAGLSDTQGAHEES